MVAEWHAPRDVEGDVHVRYTLALESIPMLQGGPPTAVRVDEIGRAHVELQSLMRISYAVFCLKKKTKIDIQINERTTITCKTNRPTGKQPYNNKVGKNH